MQSDAFSFLFSPNSSLQTSFFPPAADWFPSEADRSASADATAALAEAHGAKLKAAKGRVAGLTDQLRIAEEEVAALMREKREMCF